MRYSYGMLRKKADTPAVWTAYIVFATTFFLVSLKDIRDLWAVDDFRVKILPLISLMVMVYYAYRLTQEKKRSHVAIGFLIGLLIGGLYLLV
jgi:uncharacterized membrane protein